MTIDNVLFYVVLVLSGSVETRGKVVNFVTLLYSIHSCFHWYKKCKAAFTLTRVRFHVPVRVIRTSGAFTVTRTSTNTYNSVAIKNLVKVVKYLEFRAKVYSIIAHNVAYVALDVKIASYLYCVLYK